MSSWRFSGGSSSGGGGGGSSTTDAQHRCAPIAETASSQRAAAPADAGHAEVKDALKSTPVMLASAEHEYSKYGYKQLIDGRLLDVLQVRPPCSCDLQMPPACS